MQVRQARFARLPAGADLASLESLDPDLAWVFGGVSLLSHPAFLPTLREAFPRAELVGCTTAGEIGPSGVTDGGVVVTAVRFAHPGFRVAVTDLGGMDDSADAGRRLAQQLAGTGLHDVIVYGQGVGINGSALIQGFQAVLPAGATLAGGLAGDGGAFKETCTVSRAAISPRQ